MKEQNLNKLALGHHKDDIIETFLMNLFFQGNIRNMLPIYKASEYDIDVIRPLALVEESHIISYVKKTRLPVLLSECPFETSDASKRLQMKDLIKELAKTSSDVRSSAFHALEQLFELEGGL